MESTLLLMLRSCSVRPCKVRFNSCYDAVLSVCLDLWDLHGKYASVYPCYDADVSLLRSLGMAWKVCFNSCYDAVLYVC